MKLIDSHSHFDFSAFDNDRIEALARANKADVSHIIISSTIAKRWSNVKNTVAQFSNKHTQCHAAYGLHPLFIDEHTSDDLKKLKACLEKQSPIAIGEIGLDYFMENPDKDKQLIFFIEQLKLAKDFNLPVIIHARKSLDIVLKQLRKITGLRGSIHSFSGSEQQAKQLIELGFYLGFGGPITYTRATRLRKLVSTLPLQSILLETDSPDQPDASHHQERNEPAYLPLIAETIAELRGIDVTEVAKITTLNAQTLFKIVKPCTKIMV